MYGIIHTPDNWKHQYVCFLCPKCNGIHCLYIDLNKSEEVQGLHIWEYKYLDDNTIQLEPSYNNEISDKNPLGCGYHSPYTWQIELLPQAQWERLVRPDTF